MLIMITGFEPFAGASVNPSAQVVNVLRKNRELFGHEFIGLILPVDGISAPQIIRQALRQHHPDIVICLGEAGRRNAISVERVGLNLLDYQIPDNGGLKVTDQEVVPGGPAAYFSKLPVRAIVDRLLQKGIPAEISLSAGTFLCNQVMYSVLDEIAQNGTAPKAGFIHLPALPEQAARSASGQPSMSLETSTQGVIIAIETVLAAFGG